MLPLKLPEALMETVCPLEVLKELAKLAADGLAVALIGAAAMDFPWKLEALLGVATTLVGTAEARVKRH